MPILVADCPRCGTKEMTFDVYYANKLAPDEVWQTRYEAPSVCRRCSRTTIFVIESRWNTKDALARLLQTTKLMDFTRSLNVYFDVPNYISLKDASAEDPPAHLPATIEAAFREAATCISVRCWNAAGSMFRLSVDLATKDLLPPPGTPGIKTRERKVLAERIAWLIENGRIPRDLEDLSHSIREDGNDGTHDGTLTKDDALDMHDFTRALLERFYTEPEKVKIALARRIERRAKGKAETQ